MYSHALKGFSAVIPSAEVAGLLADGRIERIEPDALMKGTYQQLPWGVDRVE